METKLYSEAAENLLISQFLTDNKVSIDQIVTSLSPKDFYIQTNRYVFIAAQDLWKTRKDINIISLTDNLKNVYIDYKGGMLEYLVDLQGNSVCYLGACGSMETAIKTVKQYGTYRASEAFVREFAKTVEETPKESLNRLIANLTALSDVREVKVKTLAESAANAISWLETKDISSDMKTGYKTLDFNLMIPRKETIVIAARPGTGKSAFAAAVAANMATKQNKRVAFFSLEMSDQKIALRLMANESDTSMSDLLKKKYDPDHIIAAYSKIASENCFMFDTVFTIEDIVKYCRMLHLQGGLDCVFIDYLQLITTAERMATTNDRVAYISRSLKLLASELDISIIALSQMSRDIEKRDGKDKEPKMSDVRDSGGIEQDASILMFLTEDKEMSASLWANPEREKFIKAYIAKNRDGMVGCLYFKFTSNLMRFEECDKDGRITGGLH